MRITLYRFYRFLPSVCCVVELTVLLLLESPSFGSSQLNVNSQNINSQPEFNSQNVKYQLPKMSTPEIASLTPAWYSLQVSPVKPVLEETDDPRSILWFWLHGWETNYTTTMELLFLWWAVSYNVHQTMQAVVYNNSNSTIVIVPQLYSLKCDTKFLSN